MHDILWKFLWLKHCVLKMVKNSSFARLQDIFLLNLAPSIKSIKQIIISWKQTHINVQEILIEIKPSFIQICSLQKKSFALHWSDIIWNNTSYDYREKPSLNLIKSAYSENIFLKQTNFGLNATGRALDYVDFLFYF